MRKAIRIVLNVMLAVMLVCGCSPAMAFAKDGSASASSSASSSQTDSDLDPAPDPEPAPAPAPEPAPAPAPEPEPAPAPEPEPAPAPAPEQYYVDQLVLQWDKPDEFGQKHYVGEADLVEPDYKQLAITAFGEEVQLYGWYLSTDDTGVLYQCADSSTRIGSFDLTWKSSDESVATVSPNGLVSPKGKNGTVTITATVADAKVYQGEAPRAIVTIVFDGQEGKYVERVEILDSSGNAIGESWGGVTVYNEPNTFHQLQARVTWRYVATGSEQVEVTGLGEDYDAKAVGTTLTWNVSGTAKSDEAPFYVNPDTGRLKTGQYAGSAYIMCTAVGGLGGAAVSDTANMQLDTGVYRYDPAESLTLKVVWEQRPDEVVKEATYSYEELLSKLASTSVNATVVNSSRFGVIRAEGWLFKDVVKLVAVEDADVWQYRFTTSDGYDNPVSYQYLFESGNRYYFPNYDIGSTAEGEIVAPLLAYKSMLLWNESRANPSMALDDGSRFRLVFGCLGEGDANTSFQIYYIKGITVVLKGGPSAGTDPSGPSGDSTSPGGAGGSGSSGGAGGSGGSSADGSGAGAPGVASNAPSDADASSQARSIAADAAAGGEEGAGAGASKRWRVYQMMNKTNSDVPDWDDENPLSPFALPIAFGAFAVGAGATTIGFKRRL